jgi:crotonobetainyl-CoA:carnitine CoA-transferase CaiB-like acyl-CoA transferase
LYLNANKRGITLDPALPTGRELLHRLLAEADVFLHNWSPAQAETLGLQYEQFRRRHAHLIITAVTPYGSTGPYANYRGADITACAAGGVSVGTGFRDRPPLTLPLALGAHFASVAASAATLLATFGRDVTGRGNLWMFRRLMSWPSCWPDMAFNYIYRGVTGIRAGRHMSLGLYPNAVLNVGMALSVSTARNWRSGIGC